MAFKVFVTYKKGRVEHVDEVGSFQRRNKLVALEDAKKALKLPSGAKFIKLDAVFFEEKKKRNAKKLTDYYYDDFKIHCSLTGAFYDET